MPQSDLDLWLTLLGRLHPLFVHFPTALVLVAAGAEAMRAVRGVQGPSQFALRSAAVGACFAIPAALSGWMFAEHEGVNETPTLFLHRWIGFITAGLLLLVVAAGFRSLKPAASLAFGVWRVGLMFAALLIAVGGHLGGEMVYGDGFVGRAFWKAMGQSIDPEQAQPVEEPSVPPAPSPFVSRVLPILESHCYECHGNGKHKGGLNLEDLEALREPEADGSAVVVPGDPSRSNLFVRITLPRDDEDAMPPKGEGEPLTPAEVAVIEEWIKGGAVGLVRAPAALPAATSAATAPPAPLDANALASCLAALRDRGAVAQPTVEGAEAVEVNASVGNPPFGDEQMPLLECVKPVLEQLDLSRSAVTDAGLKVLAGAPRLHTLRLDRTAIGDDSAGVLADLPRLASLNVVGTGFGDAGLAKLAEVRSLRSVFVWDSKVTAAGVEAFRRARPEVRVVTGEAPVPAATPPVTQPQTPAAP